MTTATIQSNQAQRLAHEAAEAAEIRDWQDHPDVVALRVEKVRSRIDRMMWAGIILGLLFTMTSVQQFAVHAMNVGVGSLGWWAAWLLDPTVAIILLGILLAERQIASAQMRVGVRAQVSKWGLLAATYVMNTWDSWTVGSAAGIVLHSVPVLAVFAAAESVTDCQDKLTAYVQWAHAAATERARRKAEKEAAGRVAAAPPPLPPAVDVLRAQELADARHGRELADRRLAREHEHRGLVAVLASQLALGAAWRARQARESRTGRGPAPRAKPTPAANRGATNQASDLASLVARARPLLAKTPMGRTKLAEALGVSAHLARQVLERIEQEKPPTLRLAGGAGD